MHVDFGTLEVQRRLLVVRRKHTSCVEFADFHACRVVPHEHVHADALFRLRRTAGSEHLACAQCRGSD